MFSPPKLATSVLAIAAIAVSFASTTNGQNTSDYQRRLQAMQNARQRMAMSPDIHAASQADAYEYAEPPAPVRMAQAIPNTLREPIRKTQRNVVARRAPGRNYVPRHLRVSQAVSDEPLVDPGSPILESETNSAAPLMTDAMPDAGCADCGGMMGGCNSCYDDYFDCCDVGGCPPGSFEAFWARSCIARILLNSEYSIGVTGFRQRAFQIPGTNEVVQDSNFGFSGSMNFGIPLCRLTGGLLSAQFGLRSVNTNFNGQPYSADSRSQLFVTSGLYRRVDYGLQFGMVVDVLSEDWFTEADVVQLRGDSGWVFGNGTAMGFRFTTSLSSDVSSGVYNGTPFTGLTTDPINNYRFYLRRGCENGGYTDYYAGWADNSYGLIGMDADVPLNQCTALKANWTYYITDDAPRSTPGTGNGEDGWNLFIGLAWRPRGHCWYKYYDRPMFDVADNGTMFLLRE